MLTTNLENLNISYLFGYYYKVIQNKNFMRRFLRKVAVILILLSILIPVSSNITQLHSYIPQVMITWDASLFVTNQAVGSQNTIIDQDGIFHFLTFADFNETKPGDSEQEMNTYITHFWSEDGIEFQYEKIYYGGNSLEIQVFQYQTGIGLIYPDFENRVMTFWSWIGGIQQKTVLTPSLANIWDIGYINKQINSTYIEFYLWEKINFENSTRSTIYVYILKEDNNISLFSETNFTNNYTDFGTTINYKVGYTENQSFILRSEEIMRSEEFRVSNHTFYSLENMHKIYSTNNTSSNLDLLSYNSTAAVALGEESLLIIDFQSQSEISIPQYRPRDVIIKNQILYVVEDGGRIDEVNGFVFSDLSVISLVNLTKIGTYEIKYSTEIEIIDTFIDLVGNDIMYGVVRTPLSEELSSFNNLNMQTLIEVFTLNPKLPTYYLIGPSSTSNDANNNSSISSEIIIYSIIGISILILIIMVIRRKW